MDSRAVARSLFYLMTLFRRGFAAVAAVAEGFDVVVLFGGNQAAGDAAAGFAEELFPIFIGGRAVFFPRLPVAGFTRPLDVAAMDADVDLEFAVVVFGPPTELDTHGGRFRWRRAQGPAETRRSCGRDEKCRS